MAVSEIIQSAAYVLFTVLTHLILISAIVIQLLVMISLAWNVQQPVERLLRWTAFSTALLVLFGAKAMGLSISDFLIKLLTDYRPLYLGIGGVIPAIAGLMVGWYLRHSLRQSNNIASRVLIFVGVFSVAQFADAYLAAIGAAGFRLNPTLLPTLGFAIALGTYMFMRYDPDHAEEPLREELNGNPLQWIWTHLRPTTS